MPGCDAVALFICYIYDDANSSGLKQSKPKICSSKMYSLKELGYPTLQFRIMNLSPEGDRKMPQCIASKHPSGGKEGEQEKRHHDSDQLASVSECSVLLDHFQKGPQDTDCGFTDSS